MKRFILLSTVIVTVLLFAQSTTALEVKRPGCGDSVMLFEETIEDSSSAMTRRLMKMFRKLEVHPILQYRLNEGTSAAFSRGVYLVGARPNGDIILVANALIRKTEKGKLRHKVHDGIALLPLEHWLSAVAEAKRCGHDFPSVRGINPEEYAMPQGDTTVVRGEYFLGLR